jgi:hypothetical protein
MGSSTYFDKNNRKEPTLYREEPTLFAEEPTPKGGKK